jgi:hypothetical protein
MSNPTHAEQSEIHRIQQAKREYLRQSQPFVKELAAVYGRPRLVIKNYVCESYEIEYTPQEQALRASLQESLRLLRESICASYGIQPIFEQQKEVGI